ncbi:MULTISPECIES: integrating conjugative element protein [unclassified Brenneria]|uniref:integrating conjugative element protein n=1 Tax=unclassified Brenneria TaxID=2634434 RepID=UPI0018F08824|nr:integrating conjugative element protein [Brenneria sp. L3-3C-1]MBJ7223573.1 integrating conjugative element protein [Brenneria sp. L3-3C-1]MEE3644815.1 integrating conjugative element protein [Brenneria sp. L3_3C_1]
MSRTAPVPTIRPFSGPPFPRRLQAAVALLAALLASHGASAESTPLVVVEDRGGASALPYYETLNLQPRSPDAARPPIPMPVALAKLASEADMLPVRSPTLSPGIVARRVIEAPGLQPFFLIGDDDTSHAWLRRHATALRERGAVGLVVNIDTPAGLTRLREAAPGLELAPVVADDLAARLGVQHYPALITSTGIEQ